jgi:hypothetical protein
MTCAHAESEPKGANRGFADRVGGAVERSRAASRARPPYVPSCARTHSLASSMLVKRQATPAPAAIREEPIRSAPAAVAPEAATRPAGPTLPTTNPGRANGARASDRTLEREAADAVAGGLSSRRQAVPRAQRRTPGSIGVSGVRANLVEEDDRRIAMTGHALPTCSANCMLALAVACRAAVVPLVLASR